MLLQNWIQTIESDLGRKLGANENAYLRKLTELVETLDYRPTLYARDLSALDERYRDLIIDPAKALSDGLWSEPPKSEYYLWQAIAIVFHQCKLVPPPFLVSSTRIEESLRKLNSKERDKEIRLWKNRLGNLSHQRRGSDQLLDARLRLQGRAFKWEIRPSGKGEYAPLAAKDMTPWLDKGYGFLDRFAPGCLPLCALFKEYYHASKRIRLDLDKGDDCAFLNKLIHNPDTRQLLVGKEGEPIRISAEPLVWTGSEDEPDSDGSYAFRLKYANRDDCPIIQACLSGPQNLYLVGSQLHPGPAPFKPDLPPNEPVAIPAEAIESSEGLLFLRSQSLPIPARLSGKVVSIPLKLAAYCKLKDDSSFEAKLVAHSVDQLHWFALTSDGWIEIDNLDNGEPSEDAPEGALFELPAHDPLISAFEEHEFEEIDEADWSRPVADDFPNVFRSWWQRLPENAQLIADEELDGLIDDRPAGQYALAIDPSGRADWFDLSLKPSFSDLSLTESEKALLLKRAGDFVRLPGKGWRRFETAVNAADQAILNELGVGAESASDDKKALHALQLSEAKLENERFDALAKEVRKRSRELNAATPTSAPKGILTELRPYQLDGFKFLAFLSNNGFGGVLADDMGLGKTLQALTWLTWLKLKQEAAEAARNQKPTTEDPAPPERFQILVVCPKSVAHVWKQEVARHTSLLTVALYDPNLVQRPTWEAAGVDILVANYSQIRLHRGFFTSLEWTAVVLDEAQHIKNPTSQTAKTARELKAKHHVVLTGTPVENRSLDLWSLFAFAMPGLLGSQASFARHYKETDADTPQRLFRRVRHFMLRRSKAQVAPDLPDRIEETLTCQMEGEQLELYTAELKQAQSLVRDVEERGDFAQSRFNILASLLRLRQICCHPKLLDPAYADMRSAKLEALVDLVSELHDEGHKVLIFSQFVEMLEIISGELNGIHVPHLMLTGQTKNREELIERFQNETTETAFLLSLRAAGFGLNLTAASYVILYDPWWNPAVEAQAIDRTHRIGQKNAVNAYRLTAADSVEQKILALQLQKKALADSIVQEESLGQVLDLDTIKSVLSE